MSINYETLRVSKSELPQSARVLVIRQPAQGVDDIPDALAIEERPLREIGPDEVLLRTLYVSLDPAQVMWIRAAAPYMPIAAGDALTSQVVGEIMASRAQGFEPGELVLVASQIADYSVVGRDGTGNGAGQGGILSLQKIDTADGITPDLYLSLLSHTGMAACSGIDHVGHVQSGQTVLVSAAAGATGSVAAQLAKARGARVIGVAGGPEKCRLLMEFYGLDGAVDHRGDVSAQLESVAPEGIDVFFDNVGGPLLDDVLNRMKFRGRVVICGALADYGHDSAQAHRFANMSALLQRNVQLLPFWISDFEEHRLEMFAELRQLYLKGQIRLPPPHVLDGIEAVPGGFGLLMGGGNRGKLMAQLGPLPPA